MESTNDIGVRNDVGCEFTGLDIEDEDEDSDGPEDVVARLVKVILDEAILSGNRSVCNFP